MKEKGLAAFVHEHARNLGGSMSEDHRRRSAETASHLLSAIEIERLRLRASLSGIRIENRPEPAAIPGDEEFETIAEEIRSFSETRNRVSAEREGGTP